MIECSTGQLLIFIILNGRWCVAHEPFPGRGEDSREPSGSALPPAQGAVPEDDWDAEAALAAEADAGEWDLTPEWLADDEPLPLAVFCDEGLADEMGPGPVLATLVHAAIQDPAALDEDQLVGVIAAIRRIESRMAWASMTAMRELTSRRRDARDQVDCGRTKVSATAADQVSMELRQSWQSAAAPDRLRLRGRRPPPQDLRRPRRRPDPPHPRPHHRGRDPVPVRQGRGQRRRDPRRGRQDQVLRRAPLRRPPPGPQARPVLRRPPQGSRPPQRRGPPVPGGIRQRRDDRPRAPVSRGPRLLAAHRAARPGPARRRRWKAPCRSCA